MLWLWFLINSPSEPIIQIFPSLLKLLLKKIPVCNWTQSFSQIHVVPQYASFSFSKSFLDFLFHHNIYFKFGAFFKLLALLLFPCLISDLSVVHSPVVCPHVPFLRIFILGLFKGISFPYVGPFLFCFPISYGNTWWHSFF